MYKSNQTTKQVAANALTIKVPVILFSVNNQLSTQQLVIETLSYKPNQKNGGRILARTRTAVHREKPRRFSKAARDVAREPLTGSR